MPRLTVKEINEATAVLIEQHPGGIRFGEIYKWFQENHPEVKEGTLAAQIAHVVKVFPGRVQRTGRGIYQPVTAKQIDLKQTPTQSNREGKYYESFATYLRDSLQEVGEAVSLGGAAMRKKFGTPDVVGVYRSSKRDIVQFPEEIVAAEIKTSPGDSVTAFGQAVWYRLFSSKSYVVMPETIPTADYDRLESLCLLFGIGLVLFTLNPDNPNYSIRVRAQRFAPDMFYVNEFARRLDEINSDAFKRLFG